MHPLDLVKTRLQLQGTLSVVGDPTHYSGIIDCMRKMTRNEGMLSLWKGILPPVLAETPKRAVKVSQFLFCYLSSFWGYFLYFLIFVLAVV